MGYFGLTCGALAGAGIVFSNHFGDGFMDDPAHKKAFYAAVKEMCEAFEAVSGAATCDTLRKMQKAGHGLSCSELIRLGISTAERFIEKYRDTFPDRLG